MLFLYNLFVCFKPTSENFQTVLFQIGFYVAVIVNFINGIFTEIPCFSEQTVVVIHVHCHYANCGCCCGAVFQTMSDVHNRQQGGSVMLRSNPECGAPGARAQCQTAIK